MFLFEKGALLKISKKSIHAGSLFMDIYFEKKGSQIPSNDNTLVAACCLLLGAKVFHKNNGFFFLIKTNFSILIFKKGC